MLFRPTGSNAPIVLKLKKENANIPWGLKFEGGEGTGQPLIIMVRLKQICIAQLY